MFQFPRFPLSSLCVQQESTQAFPWVGFPIRASTDQCLTTTSRGLSQLSTPFFGSWRQGIHRTLLVAFYTRRQKLKFYTFYSVVKVTTLSV